MQYRNATSKAAFGKTFYVTGDGPEYTVHFKRHSIKHRRVWTCNCRDFTERQIFINGMCKHIRYMISLTSPFFPDSNSVLVDNPEPATAPSVPVPTVAANPIPTAKSVLADMAAVINKDDAEANCLWCIITALRGPDNRSHILKMKTTARIRGALGLNSIRFLVSKELPKKMTKAEMDQLDSEVDHFYDHYNKAVEALQNLNLKSANS